jgi:LPXTG-motif cell wall-anchored protein
MEKLVMTLAETGSRSGTNILIIAIAVVVVAIAGYFLLRKKK